MPICSYLVIPEPGSGDSLARRLDALSECDVTPSRTGDVLLLVTDTPGPAEDRELRGRIEGMEGIQAVVITFGEIDPDTEEADPIRSGAKRKSKSTRGDRRLPVVGPEGLSEVLSAPSKP
jgi:nitrate reductase NapAB chaperone NapD